MIDVTLNDCVLRSGESLTGRKTKNGKKIMGKLLGTVYTSPCVARWLPVRLS
jgi:hypothetical protein